MAENEHDHDHDNDHDHDHDHDNDHDHDHDHGEKEETWRRGEQTVTVEDAGPARKSLTIVVPPERIAEAIDSTYTKLKTDAAIPGFRKGRAPMRLIEKRFGSAVRDDLRGEMISETYSQAIEDEKLEVLGEPDVKDIDDIELPDEGSMTFTVEVEVIPDFEMPSLEGIDIDKPTVSVNDEDVEEEIDQLRERFGKVVDATGKIKEKDHVGANVRILAGAPGDGGDDAEEIEHLPEAWILVNGKELEFKGHVAGILIDDLGKTLKGKTIGDDITTQMTGPASHENEKIKDQPITVSINVTGIKRVEAAKVDELLEQSGFENEEELRDYIKNSLEERVQRKQESAMHDQVADHLLDGVKMDLPEGMSGRQTSRLLQRQAMELAYQGLEQDAVEQRIAEMRTNSEAEAAKQLKLFFILDRASKELDIDVTENEVNGRIAMMAIQEGRRPEKLRQELRTSGKLEQLYMQIRDQKTMEAIVAKARVNDVELTDDDEKPAKKKSKKKASKSKEEDTTDDKATDDKATDDKATKKKTSKKKSSKKKSSKK